jgi:hypothetical protein
LSSKTSSGTPCVLFTLSTFSSKHQNAVNFKESQIEGQGDENSHAVSNSSCNHGLSVNTLHSGLDNAGKTTIVKKIMNEDVNSVSPTLGFIIKTVDYKGYFSRLLSILFYADWTSQIQTQYL